MKKEFIAYAGEKLPKDRQNKTFYLFRWLGNSGKIINQRKFRYEGDKIYALKVSQDRFLCFFCDGAKVIITNAYQKKSTKIPAKEKEKALKAKNNYIERCKEGTYYE